MKSRTPQDVLQVFRRSLPLALGKSIRIEWHTCGMKRTDLLGITFICLVATWSASVFLEVSLQFFPKLGLDGLSNAFFVFT